MDVLDLDVSRYRDREHDVDPQFLRRWSPRAFAGEPLAQDTLDTLLEAARWSPSSFNNQPWRFLYAHRDSDDWQRFLGLLSENNQKWCARAAVLVVLVSKTTFDRNAKPSRTHSFSTGSAWMALALQATRLRLIAHAMQGFDYERARTELNVPDDHQVEVMIAIGPPGRVEDLPPELREREKPSGRKALSQIAFEGGFPD